MKCPTSQRHDAPPHPSPTLCPFCFLRPGWLSTVTRIRQAGDRVTCKQGGYHGQGASEHRGRRNVVFKQLSGRQGTE